MTGGSSERPAAQTPGGCLGSAQPSYRTSALFGDRREVILIHNGEHYRLRMTQNGKLILTK